MDDLRFLWFKHIVYKTLSIDFSDSAFDDMIQNDEFATEHLKKISNSNTKACIFFHCTVEEEEVEVEDVYEQIEESEKNEASTSSGSEKLEFESEFADDKTEILDNEDTSENITPKRFPSAGVAEAEHVVGGKRLSKKRSTTSLLQIIKKNVLHLSLNITTFVPSRRYVYFLKCRFDDIPVFDTTEEVFSTMPEFFEIGSINQHPLIAMRKVMSCIYSPLLKNENWLTFIPPRECKLDENQLSSALKELCQDIEEFSSSTEETISHLEEPIMFTVPNIIATCSTEELAQEQSFVTEAEELVNEWAEMISDLLEETAHKKLPESNLLGEFNFWKRQKLVLSTCYDHLYKPSIQQTIEILKIADSDLSYFEGKVAEIKKYLKVASDNFNYLSLLEPLRKNMQPEKSFEDTQKAVEDAFSILKIIWLQSNYYKEVPNMCRLIKGIAILLKDKVKDNTKVETLFRKPLTVIKTTVIQSLQLLQFWKEQYLKECKAMERYGGSYSWGFEIDVFFTETDHMILVCSDLEKIIVMLQQLHNIFNTDLKYFVRDVKGLDVLEVRIFGITSRIQYASFDIYDPANKSEWNKTVEQFQRDINIYEDEIKVYMQKMFQSLSWENAYILTKSFQKVSVSSSIQDFIDRCHDDMLKQFIKEIYEIENEFLSCKDEPPHYIDIPEIISSVIWVQDLLLKLSRPMSQICDHSDLTKREHEVMERFQKTEMLLKEYKLEKHNFWKITATERLNKFLQENVLKILEQAPTSETNDPQRVLKYQVNFPVYLEEVSVETKLFEYFGFEIPVLIKNVILQERSYYEHRHEIRMILDLLRKSISCLQEAEISILGIPAGNLCSVLDHGSSSIQWESSEVSEFSQTMKRAAAVFRNVINQVQNVFTEIDKRIECMSHCDLFEFDSYNASEVPTCEIFFGDAENRLETKTEKIVNIYSSLELLLKNLERLTCRTTSGKAIQMKKYYRRCEEKILTSLLKMTLSNFEYFKEELLENFVFPYIELACHSENELVTSSLNRAELIFLMFIKNAVESTRKIVRWLDGTCLPSPKFHLDEANEEMEFSYYLDICMHPLVKKLVLDILNDFFTFMSKISIN